MATVSAEQDSAKMSQASQTCSVCLDYVTNSERSITKLECGHHFHLDCIGSAFNAKGAMQCPNCRHVENGHWLYAKGSCSTDEFMEELLPDEPRDLETYERRVGLLRDELRDLATTLVQMQHDLGTSGRVGLLPD